MAKAMGEAAEAKGYGQSFTLFPCPFCAAYASFASPVSVGLSPHLAENAVIFAIANPEPEILPNLALEAGAKIAASGRSDFNNQINNSLVFPGFLREF